MSTSERVRERTTIDVLEFATDRNAVRDATRFYFVTMRELRDHVRSRIALYSRIRCQNRFLHAALGQQRFELRESELIGTDAIERRQMAHQHEVSTAIATGLLDRRHVRGRFDHTQQRLISRRRRADRTQLRISEHSTAIAATDAIQRLLQRFGKKAGTVAILLQQMERHALRGLRPDAGQAAQRFDETDQGRRIDHRTTVD